MRKKPIKLKARDRATLERFCTTGVHNVRLVDRAKIILALDTSGDRTAERQEAIAERLELSRQTVNGVFGVTAVFRYDSLRYASWGNLL